MTLAQKAIEHGAPIIRAAKRLGLVDVEHMDEGLTFYHMQDGSKIGTRGRGKNWQVWTTGGQNQ